jgi:hypothetical protein
VRLSDLLGREVVDHNGTSYGKVHDALLAQDGPLLASGLAAFRLHGLEAGTHTIGTQLGYTSADGRDTPTLRGPAPIRRFVEWLQRDAVYIPWETISIIEHDRITVSQTPEPRHRSAGVVRAAT